MTEQLATCEHHDDFHIRDGCYGMGSRDVMVNTSWGPEPFEEALCPCEEHLRGEPPHVLRAWRENHPVPANAQSEGVKDA